MLFPAAALFLWHFVHWSLTGNVKCWFSPWGMRLATLGFRDDGHDDPRLIFLILPDCINCQQLQGPSSRASNIELCHEAAKDPGFKIWETAKWLGTWWYGISKAGYQSLHPNFQLPKKSLSSATRMTWSIRMITIFYDSTLPTPRCICKLFIYGFQCQEAAAVYLSCTQIEAGSNVVI